VTSKFIFFETLESTVFLNRDVVKVHGEGIWRLNQAGLAATNNDEYTFVKKMFIPHKKVYKFGPGDTTVTHNQDDVYFSILCYDVFGSLSSDNIAYFQCFTEIQYKDP
jgi:hypothetical protein